VNVKSDVQTVNDYIGLIRLCFFAAPSLAAVLERIRQRLQGVDAMAS
jgi:hypothetical protein